MGRKKKKSTSTKIKSTRMKNKDVALKTFTPEELLEMSEEEEKRIH